MKITPPEIIRKYIEDERTVPLIGYKNSTWYYITAAEKAALIQFVADLDALARKEWDSLTDSEKWELSCACNDAERIVRESITREEAGA